MRILFLALIVVAISIKGPAQDSTLVTVKSGYKVTDVLTYSDIYHYPAFSEGKVFFKDGSKGMAKMNYNMLYDQMLFIDEKGDTLALDDEKTSASIAVDVDTFYFDGGYLRLVGETGGMKLVEKKNWVVADIRKIGTFNKPTTTVAINSLTSYTNGSDAAKSKELILNEDLLLRKQTQYYFADRFNHFIHANKKALLQFFEKDQLLIEDYLRTNKVDFDKKADLEKLMQFISRL